jgi:pilus assembly protein FimV
VTFSLGVRALGLGEIKLKSGLNQPLKAEIELFSPEGLSEFEVAASLASMSEFEKAGIDYFGYLKDIRFKTVKGANDSLIIEVTSRQPVKEPFLNFLVELNWPKGRMLREYTLLLDPPTFAEKKSSTIEQASSAATSTYSAPVTYSQPQAKISDSRSSAFAGDTYGPVGDAETLWRVATKVKPNGASIHQTLVALYRANPDAFVNQDINLLKRGSVLKVPSASEISAIPQRAALQDMVARTRGTSSETVLDASGRKSSGEKIVRSGDRLRLAAPETGDGTRSGSGGSAQEVSKLRNELVRTKEAAATLEAENEELRRKLQEALSQLEQKSGTVEVESSTAAALANREQVFADDESDVSTNDNDNNASSLNENEESNSASVAADSDSAGSLTTNETDSTEVPNSGSSGTDLANNTTADTKKQTSMSLNSNTQPEKSLTLSTSKPPQSNSFFDDPMYLYGSLGLVVVLLGAFLVFWKMRQRMEDEEFQDDLVVSAQGGGFDTEENIDLPGVGDDLLDDLDSDDVFDESGDTEADPLGEADIYIAYGKYEQAEKLLMEAIEADPERTDLKVKLLECYAESKEKDKFDSVENQFNDVWEDDVEAAEQVRAIKAQAWPEDAPLDDDFELPSTEEIFGDAESASDEFEEDFSLDDLDTDSDVSLDEDVDSLDIGGDEASFDTEAMDFELDDDVKSESADNDFSLDDGLLELDENDSSETESFDEAGEFELEDLNDSDGIAIQDSDLEADLDLDLDAADDLDLDSEFSLDDDDSIDEDIVDGTDEASTKLDLARAYIDMGDTDGAREILNEVVEEGNEAHKSEALSLLEKI